MQRTVELDADTSRKLASTADPEALLDLLQQARENAPRTDGKEDKRCVACKKMCVDLDDYFLVCISCCADNGPCLNNDERSLEHGEWERRRWSKKGGYKPSSYANAIISSLLGVTMPVNDPRYPSLLQEKDVPALVVRIQRELKKQGVDVPETEHTHIRAALKGLKLGKYYKYTMYLCERVNPTFEIPYFSRLRREGMLKWYTFFSKAWRRHRELLCKEFGVKRKSMPHVSSVLAYYMRKNGLAQLIRYLPLMKSIKRQKAINRLIDRVANLQC